MLQIFFVNTCKSTMQRGSPSEHMGEYTDSEVDAGEIPADNLPRTDAEQTPPLISLPNLLLCNMKGPACALIKGPSWRLQSSDLGSGKSSFLDTKVSKGAYLLFIWSQWYLLQLPLSSASFSFLSDWPKGPLVLEEWGFTLHSNRQDLLSTT